MPDPQDAVHLLISLDKRVIDLRQVVRVRGASIRFIHAMSTDSRYRVKVTYEELCNLFPADLLVILAPLSMYERGQYMLQVAFQFGNIVIYGK